MKQLQSVLFFVFVATCSTQGLAGITVNVNSDGTNDINNPAATINFQPGDLFTLTPIGIADGGAYDSWNPWGFTANCETDGTNCTNGWQWTLAAFANGDTSNTWGFGAGTRYETALQALSETRSGLTDVFGSPSYPLLSVDSFGWSSLSFFIGDSFYQDNVGGISFMYDINPGEGTIPLPGTVVLISVGLAGLGWLRRRNT